MDKLAFFLGRWKGKGIVIEKGVSYLEEVVYTVVRTEPVAVISAQQVTTNESNGKPIHAEMGFIKMFPAEGDSRRVEATFTHPFGLNEVSYGAYTSEKLELIAD